LIFFIIKKIENEEVTKMEKRCVQCGKPIFGETVCTDCEEQMIHSVFSDAFNRGYLLKSMVEAGCMLEGTVK
jgi:hypothetical protein